MGSGTLVSLLQTCMASSTICLLISVIKTRKLHPLLSVALWITDCPTVVTFTNLPVTDKGFMEKLKWWSPFCLTQCITYVKYSWHYSKQLSLLLPINSNCPPSQLLEFYEVLITYFLKKIMPDISFLKLSTQKQLK